MKLSSLILILISAVFLLGCKTENSTKTLRLGHGLDVSHSVHQAMVKMGEDLLKRSDGRLKLEIYPNQQLGTERECLELLQIGSLDMTKVSVGVLENFAPKMKVLGLPFLFRDREHSFAVLDGSIGQSLLNESEKYWLKGLGYYDAGSRSFYTKNKPVTQPSDLEGQKIRVMESVTAFNMVKALGGSPTPISWGELYTSLQQGVVDGAENNPPSFYLSRHYEVCKFYTLDEHTVLPDALLIGTYTWNKLNAKEQKWLKASVQESVKYQRILWAEAEAKALREVQKAGVEILRPDKSLFVEKVGSIFKNYKDDSEIYPLIQEIQKVE